LNKEQLQQQLDFYKKKYNQWRTSIFDEKGDGHPGRKAAAATRIDEPQADPELSGKTDRVRLAKCVPYALSYYAQYGSLDTSPHCFAAIQHLGVPLQAW